MIGRLFPLAPVLYAVATPVLSGFTSGVTDPETPFCRDRSDLIRYTQAIVAERDDLLPLFKTCRLIKAGIPITVIEATTGDSPIGSIARVRLRAADGIFLEGYIFGSEDPQ